MQCYTFSIHKLQSREVAKSKGVARKSYTEVGASVEIYDHIVCFTWGSGSAAAVASCHVMYYYIMCLFGALPHYKQKLSVNSCTKII